MDREPERRGNARGRQAPDHDRAAAGADGAERPERLGDERRAEPLLAQARTGASYPRASRSWSANWFGRSEASTARAAASTSYLAVALYHLGDPAACRNVLEPLAKDRTAPFASRATRTNLKLCEGKKS
jgi:hypothetical protein